MSSANHGVKAGLGGIILKWELSCSPSQFLNLLSEAPGVPLSDWEEAMLFTALSKTCSAYYLIKIQPVGNLDCICLVRDGLKFSSHRNWCACLSFPSILEIKCLINELLPHLWFPKAKQRTIFMLARISYGTKTSLCYVGFSVFFLASL